MPDFHVEKLLRDPTIFPLHRGTVDISREVDQRNQLTNFHLRQLSIWLRSCGTSAGPIVWKHQPGREQLLGYKTFEFTASSTSTVISLLGNFGSTDIGLDNVHVYEEHGESPIGGSSSEHLASAANPQDVDVQSAIAHHDFLLI